MSNPSRPLLLTLLALLLFSAGFWLGKSDWVVELKEGDWSFRQEVKPLQSSAAGVDLSLFWRVWGLLKEGFLNRPIPDEKLLYGAIAGLARATGDPYTAFLPPDENKEIQSALAGTYEGVGVELGMKDGQLVVIAPLNGSPAQKAGILPSDAILAIDSQETVGVSLAEAVRLIRGKAGTSIELTLRHEADEKLSRLRLVREVIRVESVELVRQDGKVAVIRLTRFGDNTQKEWDDAVLKIRGRPETQRIVLDLRNNPGGFLEGAVYVASDFYARGKVVEEENASGQRQSFFSDGKGRLAGYSVVVLINKGSASSAEILALALSENISAKIVGEVSFGKGTIQEVNELEGGSSLHLTTARWLSSKGVSVEGKGITPTVSTVGLREEEALSIAFSEAER